MAAPLPVFNHAAEWAAAQSIQFSADVLGAVRPHLRLLREISYWPCLNKGRAAARAIFRYEECWLPLVAAVQDGSCQVPGGHSPMPPLDVNWVWHCHRLNPLLYGLDCYTIYNQVLDCTSAALNETEEKVAQEATAQLWTELYPDEPFHLDLQEFEQDNDVREGDVSKDEGAKGDIGGVDVSKDEGAQGVGDGRRREVEQNGGVEERLIEARLIEGRPIEAMRGGSIDDSHESGGVEEGNEGVNDGQREVGQANGDMGERLIEAMQNHADAPQSHVKSLRNHTEDVPHSDEQSCKGESRDTEGRRKGEEGVGEEGGDGVDGQTEEGRVNEGERRGHRQGRAARIKIDHDLGWRLRVQSIFYYNVSEPHFLDERFIACAVERYKGFLHMMRYTVPTNKQDGTKYFLVPTYDIDLLWHTHQRFPNAYARDTVAIVGKVIRHEEEENRTEGQRLAEGFSFSQVLWEKLFGTTYIRAGTLYCGKSPKEVPLLAVQSSIGNDLAWRRTIGTEGGDGRGEGVGGVKGPEVKDETNDEVNAKLGLKARHTFKVMAKSIGLEHMGTDSKARVTLNLSALSKCHSFDFSTKEIDLVTTQARFTWQLCCEQETEGLRFAVKKTAKEPIAKGWRMLMRTRSARKGMEEEEVIGQMELRWKDVLDTPWRYINKRFDLQPIGQGRKQKRFSKLPMAHLDVSLTMPVQAPYLLQSSPQAEGESISNGGPIDGAVLNRVTDHQNSCTCFLRRHPISSEDTAKGFLAGSSKRIELLLSSCASPNRPLSSDGALMGKVLYEAHQVSSLAVNSVPGSAVASVHWVLANKWSLSVTPVTLSSDMAPLSWTTWKDRKGRSFQVNFEEHGADVVPSVPAVPHVQLVHGRWLAYQVDKGKEEKEGEKGKAREEEASGGYWTLIRFSSEEPKGKATALLDVETGRMEVSPQENAALVLLLTAALSESLAALANEKFPSPLANAVPRFHADDNWGAVLLDPSGDPCWSCLGQPSLVPWWTLSPSSLASKAHPSVEPHEHSKDK
eukprot:TRINITY_DN653_c0_g1_i1.p1 TRINITY_DN653_c0_g1~~TRINITY_DN653_c0_g1_i1.p1  ORF type:complete len:1019 (-),score=176.43 TRINITY_DN653_c0_g1_i1:385-3441(-)